MSEELSFGRWLRRRRRALDLTQKALANQVGCAEITVRRMEADAYKPSKELASVLFEKLGIPESERPQWISFARGTSNLPTRASPRQKKQNSNLPASLTSFIGREKEQADAIQLIRKHRLVTLTGSGGVWKTRFAIKVGEQLLENYSDGVWWIELASLNDPKLLPRATAKLFGLISQPNIPDIDLLINFLRVKSALLILDNCEHLLDACAHLADTLLKHCPNLTLLVTSRVPLEIIGEARYRIPSLRIPEHQDQFDNLKDNESVKLFEERAQLIRFNFSLTPENASSVAQICHHLNGIPLAIELAAAKAGVLSTAQIAQQLGESLDLLTGGSRTELPRHQTLRASVNWSWSLLTQAEQQLMRQLSVFAGGWTLEAAQSVCDGDVSGLLHSLVTKSLIVMNRETKVNTRYSFHEIIRQYAHEKLEEHGESEAVRGRHLDYFLAVALRFEHEVHGVQALNWIKRVSAEHDNLHEALNWAGESGQVQSGLRLGYALHYYWLNKGYWSLGRESLERLLAHPEAAEHTIARANALNLAGDLAFHQGDLETAWALLKESKVIGMELGASGKPCLGWACMQLGQSLMGYDNAMAQDELEQSIVLLREAGESWRFAVALLVRGILAENQGNLMQARALYSECLEIFRSIGDTWTSALPTTALGRIFYYLGDYDAASSYLQQGLEILRTMEGQYFLPIVLTSLGSITLLQGDVEQAIIYFDERLSITRELMNKEDTAYALCDLGIALKHQGDMVRAKTLFREGLKLCQIIDNVHPSAACLTGLASITQSTRRAAQMLAAAQFAFESSWEYVEPLHRIEHERAEKTVRIVLGEADFASAWEEGKEMPLEQAIAYALEENDE